MEGRAQDTGPTCSRSGCNTAPYNGKFGGYCSRSCREEDEKPQCMKFGCANLTADGNVKGYCSAACKDSDSQPKCARPGCIAALALAGSPSVFCSETCFNLDQALRAICGNPGCKKPTSALESSFCSEACRQESEQARCLRHSCLKPALPEMLFCSPTCRDEDSLPKCLRPGCFYATYNGKAGEYCSRFCRGHRWKPKCNRLGCKKPTCNNKEQAFCSEACFQLASRPKCKRQDCMEATESGLSEDYCSAECMQKVQEEEKKSQHPADSAAPSPPPPALVQPRAVHSAHSSSAQADSAQGPRAKMRRIVSGAPSSDVHPSRSSHGSQAPACVILTPMLPWIRHMNVIAFHYPGKELECDKVCGCSFLSNFFGLGAKGMTLTPPQATKPVSFRNAAAAYQATWFWWRAHEFSHLSGEEALDKASELEKEESADLTVTGYKCGLHAMKAVLEEKFKSGAAVDALLETREAFLLEHNSVIGRDKIWSDDGNGEGENLLGLMLMIIREKRLKEQHLPPTSWDGVFQLHMDKDGNPTPESRWQETVRMASKGVIENPRIGPPKDICRRCVAPHCHNPTYNGQPGEHCSPECKQKEMAKPQCKREGCGKKTYSGLPNEYCSRECREQETKPRCSRFGCSGAPFNGKFGEYCSRACREEDKKPKCQKFGCPNLTFDGSENGYCSTACQHSHEQKKCARPGCITPLQPGSRHRCCSPECRDLNARLDAMCRNPGCKKQSVQYYAGCCSWNCKQESAKTRCLRYSCLKPMAFGHLYCSKECDAKDRLPKCMRPGCSEVTHNGRMADFCSPFCRDHPWRPKCKRVGCMQPTCSNKEGDFYCSEVCLQLRLAPKCKRQDCMEGTESGLSDEYCSSDCHYKDNPSEYYWKRGCEAMGFQ